MVNSYNDPVFITMDATGFDSSIPATVKAILKSHINNCLLKYEPDAPNVNLFNSIVRANTQVWEEYRVIYKVKNNLNRDKK